MNEMTNCTCGADEYSWPVQHLPPCPLVLDSDDVMAADSVEGIGLDSTGRDLDPRFPYRLSTLTADEWTRLIEYHRTGKRQLP